MGIYSRKTVQLAGFNIELLYKNVNNFNLHVAQGEISISVPIGATMADVEQLVLSKQEWLQKSVPKSLRGAGRNTEISTFYDGTAIYIWGKRYEICLYDHAGKESYQLIGDKLFLYAKRGFSERKRDLLVHEMLKSLVAAQGKRLLDKWSAKMGLLYSEVYVQYWKSMWGKCTIDSKKIGLNMLLACYPPECLELVVVHELTHLLEVRHNARFHDIVEYHLPDWKQREKILKTKPFLV